MESGTADCCATIPWYWTSHVYRHWNNVGPLHWYPAALQSNSTRQTGSAAQTVSYRVGKSDTRSGHRGWLMEFRTSTFTITNEGRYNGGVFQLRERPAYQAT